MGLAIFKGCPLDRLIVLLDHFKHILSFFLFFISQQLLAVSVYRSSHQPFIFTCSIRSGDNGTRWVWCSLELFAVKTNLWHETQVFPMPKESFFESVADKWCLFRPTAGHFSYQWLWVMRRDFPPLPLSSHPICQWWQWDFRDRSISHCTLLSSSKCL